MSSPTLTPMIRFTLAAALALGLAAAPSAQQRTAADDTDAPGTPLAPSPETVGLSFFDDQDQAIRLQTRRQEASASAAITTQPVERRADGSVADSDDLSAPLFFPTPTERRVSDGPLADGRDGSTPAPRPAVAVAVDAMTANGRTEESLLAAQNRAPSAELHVEALDNGRPPGTRPGAVVLDDDAPEQVAAPLADAADEPARTGGLTLSVVQPNPAHSQAWVTASVDAPTRATVTLYDIQGREVAKAFDGLVAADTPTRVRLDLDDVSAGTYVVVLEAGGVRSSQTVQVVR